MKHSIYQNKEGIYSFEITKNSISNVISTFYSMPFETLGAFLIRIAPQVDMIIASEIVSKKEEELSEEFKSWCNTNKFPLLSADELYDEYEEILSDNQKTYIKDFIERWNSNK